MLHCTSVPPLMASLNSFPENKMGSSSDCSSKVVDPAVPMSMVSFVFVSSFGVKVTVVDPSALPVTAALLI